jgi:hypothetical protein
VNPNDGVKSKLNIQVIDTNFLESDALQNLSTCPNLALCSLNYILFLTNFNLPLLLHCFKLGFLSPCGICDGNVRFKNIWYMLVTNANHQFMI